MSFEIENFRQFKPGGNGIAGFSLKTDVGFYYDCKLVKGGDLPCGHFVACNQTRSYEKNDGTGKAFIKSFGALRDTPASEFLNRVAEEAVKLLKPEEYKADDPGRPFEPAFNPDDDVPY